MDIKKVLSEKIEDMHHAQLFVGDPEYVKNLLHDFLEVGNPDIFSKVYETFTIDDARELKDIAYLKPVEQNHRIFFVGVWSMTEEAQNALLKLFEEPSETSRFFIVVPKREILIPTVISRMSDLGDFADAKAKISVSKFISSKPAERLKIVEPFLKQKSKAEVFISELEKEYHKNGDLNTCKDLWETTRMLGSNVLTIKLVLENLSLTLPTS